MHIKDNKPGLSLLFPTTEGLPPVVRPVTYQAGQGNLDLLIQELNNGCNILGTTTAGIYIPAQFTSTHPEADDEINLLGKQIKKSVYVSCNLSRPVKKIVLLKNVVQKEKFIAQYRTKKPTQSHRSKRTEIIPGGQNEVYVGFDVGGTFIKGIAISRQNQIIDNTIAKVTAPKTRNEIIPTLNKLFNLVIHNIRIDTVSAVGIGIPGFADSAGTIIALSNLPSWNGFPLGKELGTELSKKVGKKVNIFIDNDGNLAGLRNNLKLNKTSSITFTVGTGIGGGIVIQNQIYHGVSRTAGEMHFTIPGLSGPDLSCGCGIKSGCFESLNASRGIVRRVAYYYHTDPIQWKDTALRELAGRVNKKGVIQDEDCKHVGDAAVSGDMLAKFVIAETVRNFVTAMRYLYELTGVNDYIFTGGVVQGNTGKLFNWLIQNQIRKNKNKFTATVIESAGAAGAEGAAMLATAG